MRSRYIPRIVNFLDGTYGEDTLFYRFPMGDNILSKTIYNNVYLIQPGSGKTLDDAPLGVDLAHYEKNFYLRIWDTPTTYHWLKLYLGPIPVRFDSIYTKEEMDFLLAALSFEGSLID